MKSSTERALTWLFYIVCILVGAVLLSFAIEARRECNDRGGLLIQGRCIRADEAP
jgi:hypothetical protein